MAITWVGAGAVALDASGGAGTTPALPSGFAADDILIAVVTDSSSSAPAAPSGWTRKAATALGVYWKRATGSDSAPVFSGGGTQKSVVGAWRGCIGSGDPFDAFGTQTQTFAPGDNTVAAITTTARSWVVMIANGAGGSLTPSSSAAPTNDVLSQSGSPAPNLGLLVNNATGTNSGGSTGTSTVTLGAGGSECWTQHFSLLAGAVTSSDSETLDLEEDSYAYGPLNILAQTDFQWNAFQQNAFQIYGGVVGGGGPSPQTDAKSETLTLSDSEAAAAKFAANDADTLTLSDATAAGLKTIAVDSDTLTLSDSLAAAAKFPAAVSDTITLSEAYDAFLQSGAGAQTADAAETVTLSDSMAASAVFAAAKSETVTLSEAETAQAKFAAVEAETLTLSDSEVARLLAGANWSETVTISDAYTARGAFGSTWAETLTLSDTSTATLSSPSGTLQTGVASETITLGESSAASLLSPQAYAATHSEALALADAYEATLLRAATYESLETLTLGESSAARVMLALPVTLAVGNHVNDGEYVQAQTAVQSLLDLHHQAPTVTGAKGGNAALASLLQALQQLGILRDGST